MYQHAALGLTYMTVASNLNIDASTVCRTLQLFRRTGEVTKQQYDATNLSHKLTDEVQLILLEVVLEQPGIKLHELQTELKYLTGTEVATSTICQFLYKNGFSRQKMRIAASQRDADLRSRYVSELSVYKAEMFIFLDETGTDRRDVLRRHAYSLRGKPAVAHRLQVRGQRLSSIAIMSIAGVLDCEVVSGSVDGEVYYDFVRKRLLPHLMPFNGTNPHSVVVLDNASIHHVQGIMSMVEEVGALVLYLPPHSPDFNPIEELFSKIKTTIKDNEIDLELQEMNLEEIVLAAFSTITESDCYTTGLSMLIFILCKIYIG